MILERAVIARRAFHIPQAMVSITVARPTSLQLSLAGLLMIPIRIGVDLSEGDVYRWQPLTEAFHIYSSRGVPGGEFLEANSLEISR